METKRVLSVGQCGFDHGNMTRVLKQTFGAEVIAADTATEALAQLRREPFAVVLVNRVLDADGSSGLELIRRVRSDEKLANVPIMLVSNHEDAQQEAARAGAVPGFGKAAMGRPEMTLRLKPYLG